MPAQRQNFAITEIKAGIFVLASVAVLIIFVLTVKNLWPQPDTKAFHVYMSDTGGLNEGADVRFGGAKLGAAGKVTNISLARSGDSKYKGRVAQEDPPEPADDGADLDAAAAGFDPPAPDTAPDAGTDAPDEPAPSRDDRPLLRIDFTVRGDVPVNTQSRVLVAQTSLTSEKHLEITLGDGPGILVEPGSELQPAPPFGMFDAVSAAASAAVSVLDDVEELIGVDRYAKTPEEAAETGAKELRTIADILDNVNAAAEKGRDLMQDAREIVQDGGEDVERILTKVQEIEDGAKDVVEQVYDVIDENRPNIRETIEGVKETVASAQEGVASVNVILDNAKEVSGRLGDMADSLEKILNNADRLSNEARILVENNRSVLEDMILDLRETVRNLKDFSRVVSENPQAILRGQEPQGRTAR